MEVDHKRAGVTNHLRLHVFEEPSITSEVVCKLRYLTNVLVDLDASTDEFYKIYTAVGAEGYCLKEHIILR